MFNLFNKKPKKAEKLQKKSFSGDFNSNFYPSLFLNDITADFITYDNPTKLLYTYQTNPIVNAVINIKANAFSNLRFKIEDLKTGEILPLEKYQDSNVKLLLTKPTAFQNIQEWLKKYKTDEGVFGNTYTYASVGIGMPMRLDNINTLNLLPPYLTKPVATGKWLETRDIKDIIKYYRFKNVNSNNQIEKYDPERVMHLNESNIEYNLDFLKGKSKLVALAKPVSNIDKALESRNVLIRRRGALGFLSSDKQDASLGTLPLDAQEVQQVQDAYKKYGTLGDQYQLMIFNQPLTYQQMGMSVKDLMLFEEVESSTITIANAYGVPELLVKQYVNGGTFENLTASERRLYDSTIIPETEVFIKGLNDFLKTSEAGIKIHGTYEHVKVLQKSQKEESETNKTKEQTALSAFKVGAINYNKYLQAIGLPQDEQIGELRVWDLDDRQIGAILSNRNVIQDNNNNTPQNE